MPELIKDWYSDWFYFLCFHSSFQLSEFSFVIIIAKEMDLAAYWFTQCSAKKYYRSGQIFMSSKKLWDSADKTRDKW